MILAASSSIDWPTVRDTIDLTRVATDLLGPALRREGRRLFWICRFHDDHHPSLWIDPTKRRWGCYPCGIEGDAAALVMKLRGVAFPEAVEFLTGRPAPTSKRPPKPRQRPSCSGTANEQGGMAPTRPAPTPSGARPPADRTAEPSGVPEADALAYLR